MKTLDIKTFMFLVMLLLFLAIAFITDDISLSQVFASLGIVVGAIVTSQFNYRRLNKE